VHGIPPRGDAAFLQSILGNLVVVVAEIPREQFPHGILVASSRMAL